MVSRMSIEVMQKISIIDKRRRVSVRRTAGAAFLAGTLLFAGIPAAALPAAAEEAAVEAAAAPTEENALAGAEEITPMIPPANPNRQQESSAPKVTAVPKTNDTPAAKEKKEESTSAGGDTAKGETSETSGSPKTGENSGGAKNGASSELVGNTASSTVPETDGDAPADPGTAAGETAASASEPAAEAGGTEAAAESTADLENQSASITPASGEAAGAAGGEAAEPAAAGSNASSVTQEAESTAESTAPQKESGDSHSPWYRSWKIHMLDVAEANQRAHKERILTSRLKIELLSDGIELPDSADIFYICDNGADYMSTYFDGDYYVYQACITKAGQYFLASDTINDAIADHVISLIDDSMRLSTADFWNHVLLRDAPQTAYRFSKDRPKDANGIMMVPYYNQGLGYFVNGTWLFTEWPGVTFDVNGHTMHEAGCGFFATAMALSYVMQRIVSPVEFKENGQYIADQGAAFTVGTVTAADYGVDAYITGDINEVLMALRNGQPVMEHVGAPPFTNYGHYILLVGVLPDGTIAVNDPGHKDNTYWYCGVSWPVDVITSCAKEPATAFTVFG